MLATLISHYDLVQAVVGIYDSKQSRMSWDYRFTSYCLTGTLVQQHGGAPEGGDASGWEQ